MKKLFIKDLELRRSFSGVPITTLALGEEGKVPIDINIKRPNPDPIITLAPGEGGTDPK